MAGVAACLDEDESALFAYVLRVHLFVRFVQTDITMGETAVSVQKEGKESKRMAVLALGKDSG